MNTTTRITTLKCTYLKFACDECLNVLKTGTMDELDVPQMKREVESLQYQLAINREKSSITVTE